MPNLPNFRARTTAGKCARQRAKCVPCRMFSLESPVETDERLCHINTPSISDKGRVSNMTLSSPVPFFPEQILPVTNRAATGSTTLGLYLSSEEKLHSSEAE